MGMLILFIAIILEIALAIYCIVTRKTNKPLRNWVRVAVFVAFVILVLLSVIVWSFRWVMLGALLFILAAIGVAALFRNKADPQEHKHSRVIGKTIGMIFALIVALAPALLFPQHQSPQVTGAYEVATASYTYVDTNRTEEFIGTGKNRFVNVQFWYPKHADGTYPLVVFSHGAYGVKASNTSTYTELASHGYVVCSIDHPYHSFYTVSDDGTRAFANSEYMREIKNANTEGVYTTEEVYGLFQKWMKLRTDDMNFVIDTILAESQSDKDPMYRLINPDQIGVFGHSMGGSASVWLSRERDDISAVVNIDAPLFSELVYDNEIHDFVASGEAYTTPLLNIYSDSVWVQLDNNSIYAANKAIDENATDAYTVHFQGAKHLSLTDLSLFAPVIADMLQGGKADIDKYDCIETENDLILTFFDYALKGIGRFTAAGTY